MFRPCDSNLLTAVCTRRGVALAFQTADRDGMQFADEMFRQQMTVLDAFFDIGHGGLDVAHFPQLVGRKFSGTFQLAFHVICQGGVIALDAGRTQTFEHVEDMLELKKHRSRRGAD